MKNNIYFMLSLFVLLAASFQLLEAQEEREVEAVEYVDRFPPNQCIATVRKNGRVLLYCGDYMQARCLGCGRIYLGFEKKRIKALLNILGRKGYFCRPGRIYEYKENEADHLFNESPHKAIRGQWYIKPVLDAEDLDERFDPDSVKEIKIPYLCSPLQTFTF